MNEVRKACKSFGLAAIALFQQAWTYKHKTLDRRAARLAHSAYQRTKSIPSWVTTYIEHLHRSRAAAGVALAT